MFFVSSLVDVKRNLSPLEICSHFSRGLEQMEASDAVSWNFGPQAKIPTLFLSFYFVSGFVICVLVVSVVNRAPSLDCGEVRRKTQFLHALAFNPFSGSSTQPSWLPA